MQPDVPDVDIVLVPEICRRRLTSAAGAIAVRAREQTPPSRHSGVACYQSAGSKRIVVPKIVIKTAPAFTNQVGDAIDEDESNPTRYHDHEEFE
jgi:hypothetical protein